MNEFKNMRLLRIINFKVLCAENIYLNLHIKQSLALSIFNILINNKFEIFLFKTKMNNATILWLRFGWHCHNFNHHHLQYFDWHRLVKILY